MTDNLILNKSFSFAVDTVDIYKGLCSKNEYVLSKQLLRSGTSVGANVREALDGQSKKDFLSKMNIALKESKEAEDWIRSEERRVGKECTSFLYRSEERR